MTLLATLFACYRAGFPHRVQLDDEANLQALVRVHDRPSAVEFVFGGNAGPLGRPLALATFLLDRHSWPDAPQDVLRTNALLHLLNTVLLAWLALRLAPHLPWRVPAPAYALSVAALWGGAPLLLSASLMAVQRMTTLAGTFGLLGTLCYLVARERSQRNPPGALCGITVAVGGATLAGVLCKETGALLPLMIWALEATLLGTRLPFPGRWQPVFLAWRLCFFALPLLLLCAYTASFLSASVAEQYAGRGWGLGERLLTEARILFTYLRLLIVPARAELGLFHDDIPVSTGLLQPWTTLPAVLGCVGVAALLAVHSRKPLGRLLAFAVGWFAIGHVLESTVFPLELYFEHRNYLPAVGVALAFPALAWHPGLSSRPLARGALLLLIVFNLAVLRETALTWGSPVLAGERWFARHPASHRAVMYYSRVVAESGDVPRAVAIVDAAAPELQRTLAFAAARLGVYCLGRRDADIPAAQDAVDASLRGDDPVDYPVVQDLGLVLDLQSAGKCPAVDPARVVGVLDSLTRIPIGRIHPRALAAAHDRLARYWLQRRNLDRTMWHLEQQYAYSGAGEVVESMVNVLLSAGLTSEAEAKLDELRARKPWHPARRAVLEQRIARMQAAIGAAAASEVPR